MKTHYLRDVFDPASLPGIVQKMIGLCSAIAGEHPFECLAFSGHSGAAVAWPMSLLTGWPLVCVRKEGDGSHYAEGGGGLVEGYDHPGMRYLIVDDQVSSGSTVRRMVREIKTVHPDSVCVGVVRYHQGDFRVDMQDVRITEWSAQDPVSAPTWHIASDDLKRQPTQDRPPKRTPVNPWEPPENMKLGLSAGIVPKGDKIEPLPPLAPPQQVMDAYIEMENAIFAAYNKPYPVLTPRPPRPDLLESLAAQGERCTDTESPPPD